MSTTEMLDQKQDKRPKGASLSEVAFLAIRQRILRGDVQPGEKLKIEVLEREQGLSSSPLREALNRLAAEKLVVADNNRGFRAAPISVEEMRDITEFRLVIEPEAFRVSIVSGNDEWEAGVVGAFHRLERVRERLKKEKLLVSDEWTDRHKEFHTALVSAAPSRRLLSTCALLFDQAERYRRFSFINGKRTRNTDAEHQRLMEAAVARKVDLAVALLREHIAMTAKSVIELIESKQ